MNCTTRRTIVVMCMLFWQPIGAISIVYNFRIAQITKQPIFEKTTDKERILVALIFDQFRKKHTGVRQQFLGGLTSFIYDFSSYYFRTDFAVSHIKEKLNGITTFSGTQTDDILFTFGRNFVIDNRNVITLSGMLGLPTHQIDRLRHIDFGYSQIGTGIQVDGSFDLNQIDTLLYGARYIYFVPRNAKDTADETFRFTLGNIVDFLAAMKKKWNQHGFEFGYTARFRFGAHINPDLDDIVKRANYIRSNFYGVYKYKFIINNVLNRLLFNISYGFDHAPKRFGNAYVITLWASWNISF